MSEAYPVTIRRVSTADEYDECVRIELEVWGAGFTEAVPATILRISQEVGGVTAAAFDSSNRMLGFVFGITGVRNGGLAHWSDILAVRPEARDTGIGTRLKYFQRDLLREIGVRTMYWTYDPLVARNAFINIERLGARVVGHNVNYYGAHTGSEMHSALGTDRFIVEWDLASDSVSSGRISLQHEHGNAPIVNGNHTDFPRAPLVRVRIPGDIFAVLAANPARALEWRSSTRRSLEWYLGEGYSVSRYVPDEAGGCYLLAAGSYTGEPPHGSDDR